MTLPGTSATIRDEAASLSAALDTATLFAVGGTERGPAAPRRIRSMGAFVDRFGRRTVRSQRLYDYLDAAFHEGLGQAYVMPGYGAGPATASGVLEDGLGEDWMGVQAAGAGTWGNDVSVDVITGGSGDEDPFQIEVLFDGEVVVTSPEFATIEEAALWAAVGDWVRFTDEGGGNPDAQTIELAGGGNGAALDDASIEAALNAIPRDLGPGQVAAPAFTSVAVHADLLAHGLVRLRNPLLDLVDSASADDLINAVAAARSANAQGARFAQAYAPWAIIPGLAAGVTRKVPYSAIQAGLLARSQDNGNAPNVPAAGENGIARYAVGLSQEAWSDADREALNDGGVTVARQMRGQIRTYGLRSIVDPDSDPRWIEFAGSREVVYILAACEPITERYFAAMIDGRGRKIADYRGDLQGECLKEYGRDALYGETPADAFAVDTSGNTPDSIAARRLVATLQLRTSPGAERVDVELVRQLTNE